MQYPVFFFIFLSFLSANPAAKEQAENKPLTDSVNCQHGLMQYAWYNYGVDSTLPPFTDQRKDFIISVDKNCKATNFISHIEYATRRFYPKDTGSIRYYYPSKWDTLSVSEKFELLAKEITAAQQRANSEHARNNNGRHVIRIMNNTTDTVFLQAQDGSIMAVMQGLTKNGQWCPIQYWQFSKCGNSYSNIGFLPNTTGAFVAQLPNRGNYETKFRFKLLGKDRFYYSNEFTGKIDYCEFTTPSAHNYYKLDTLLPARLRSDRIYPM
jgi:hypothetical protein